MASVVLRRRPVAGTKSPLTVVYRPLKQLKIDGRNARTHDAKQIAQLAASIKQFGFTNPILVDESDVIIAGHARREAANILGLDQVPTIKLSRLSDAQRRALAIADNKIALNAGWNDEILIAQLKTIIDHPAVEIDPIALGFDTVELDDLLDGGPINRPSKISGDNPDDQCPAVGATPAISRPGDIFRLGPHRLVCGDARDHDVYKALMGKERARMAFLDPPYNTQICGHVSGLGKKQHREFVMGSGEMSESAFVDFLSTTLSLTARFCVPGAIIYVCMDWRHLNDLLAATVASKLEQKNLVVWNKTNAGMGTFYRSKHELIFVLKWGESSHINNFGLGAGGRYRTNVWDYPGCNTFRRGRATELDAHPTPKPVALVADAIRDVSHRGDIVADSFGGSGTTLIAAEKTRRRARLIELDPLYVDVIVRRWQAFSGAEAVHEASGKTFAQLEDERSR
ncbi:MAG: ParB N-terminal domain-containing protein [Alphaproteobacteria bacterium]|nr:ParB N-terminal domain-containing protein [Alphaproteobacteria bacterium]